YVPAMRERMEIEIVCASPNLDLVATGLGYAREVAIGWRVSQLFVKGRSIDRGDLLARGTQDGKVRLSRIGTWRFGPHLVIVRAQYNPDHATEAQPVLAEIFGTFAAQQEVHDPVQAEVRRLNMAGSGRTLMVSLPKHWREVAGEVRTDVAAHLFTDSLDPAGDSAIALVWRALTPEQTEKLKAALGKLDSPLSRKIVVDVVDIEISNLLSPETRYRLDGDITVLPLDEDVVGSATQIFVDRVTLAGVKGQLESVARVISAAGQMVVIGQLAAAPDNALRRARALHATFVATMVLESLRAPLAP
ncbi:MAG: hypothetical protein ACK5JT_08550, partial [Hyphomicrobiaceae bacterium]